MVTFTIEKGMILGYNISGHYVKIKPVEATSENIKKLNKKAFYKKNYSREFNDEIGNKKMGVLNRPEGQYYLLKVFLNLDEANELRDRLRNNGHLSIVTQYAYQGKREYKVFVLENNRR